MNSGGGTSPLEAFADKYLANLPEAVQYIFIIGLVLVILYVCLLLTKWLGKNKGEKIAYDNNEENDKNVPDIFASTMFRRGKKSKDTDSSEQDE